jgi:predicted hydrocarbon binding protein
MKKTLMLKLLATGKLSISEGQLSLGDTSFNLLPAVFLSTLTEQYHESGELHKLYLISWLWGYDTVQSVKRNLGLDEPEEVYKVGMDFAQDMGIGLYDTHDYHPGRYTRFKIETNPYFKHLKHEKFDKPIDYIIAGAMAGGGSHVHEDVCQTVELKCMIVGNEVCDFLTGTEEELKDRGLWSKAEERYDLEKILEFQKDVYANYEKSNSEEFVEKLVQLLDEL